MNPFHGGCKLTRKNTRDAHMSGKPLGFITAWLARGHETLYKQTHWESREELAYDLDLRTQAREELKLLPGGEALIALERQIPEGSAEPAEEPIGP